MAGPLHVEHVGMGNDFSYWVSKALGYALLGGALFLALSSPFIL